MDFHILNQLYRSSKEFSHSKIHMKDLSDTECMICTYIHSHPGCSQEDVAKCLKIDKTTVAKALAVLENQNDIIRTQDTLDRRKKKLTITENGFNKISDIMNIHNVWFHEVLKVLSKDEQKQFEAYCIRLLSKANELSAHHSLK